MRLFQGIVSFLIFSSYNQCYMRLIAIFGLYQYSKPEIFRDGGQYSKNGSGPLIAL
jgi:hypothetical protein